jgi:UDP-2,3-diacylglucosamine pyrophosphatase LpxH
VVRQKVKFVLSDLHLGAAYGRKDDNQLESFSVDNEFIYFLNSIVRESERDWQEVELIINGNFLDFLQVPALKETGVMEAHPIEAYPDSSEAASIKRLNLIHQAHYGVFEALSNFMQSTSPQRRLTIIKGNHDVHFYWPRVKSRLRELLNASGGRSSLLLFAEEFVSREKIYIEHGHQRAEPINRYSDFHIPFLPRNPSQLDYPVGSRLIIELSQQMNLKPHLAPITTLLWYALQWDLKLAAKLLTKLFQNKPIRAMNMASVAKTASLNGDVPSLDDQPFQSEAETYQLLQQAALDKYLRRKIYHQIQIHLNLTDQKNGLPPFDIDEANDNPVLIAQAEQQHYRHSVCRTAEVIAQREGAQIVLFGHTHYACQEILEDETIYVNTGCWVEDLSDAAPEIWSDIFANGYQPNRPLSLPYARIDYDETNIPTVQLLDFANSLPADDTSNRSGLSQKVFDWLNRWRSDHRF